ncbi:MAG: SHOCT domain-containing protein [Oscillospiraceae bacterium]|nr:SHOCT domain-containing protein [Oscillospiraceae bacterium]
MRAAYILIIAIVILLELLSKKKQADKKRGAAARVIERQNQRTAAQSRGPEVQSGRYRDVQPVSAQPVPAQPAPARPVPVEQVSEKKREDMQRVEQWRYARTKQDDAEQLHSIRMDSCEQRLESLRVLYDAGILDREEYEQRVARVKSRHDRA